MRNIKPTEILNTQFCPTPHCPGRDLAGMCSQNSFPVSDKHLIFSSGFRTCSLASLYTAITELQALGLHYIGNRVPFGTYLVHLLPAPTATPMDDDVSGITAGIRPPSSVVLQQQITIFEHTLYQICYYIRLISSSKGQSEL